ncbi:MAG: alpha/beta hydrolase [Flexilinea sp.]|nr:alpha/beta hydrolase [Flexilinea sp.]
MKNYTGNALIIHGTADNIAPITYSERAADTMKAAALLKIEGAEHGFYGKDNLTATEAAINFINQYK